MLAPAERALVDRDPELPGLRLLLDQAALAHRISDLIGRDVAVRRRHLRYKPGTSCVVHVDADGRSLLISALPPAEPAKHAKTTRRLGTAVLDIDDALGVLIGTPAADRDLPALSALADPERRRRLVHRMSRRAELPVDTAAEPAVLRYKPHRRWVGLLPTHTGHPVLLRVHRPHLARAAAAGWTASAGGEPRTPALIGRSWRHGVFAVEYLPGRPGHRAAVEEFAPIGGALARLHRRPAAGLVRRPLREDAGVVAATARQLGILLPPLADTAARLADRVVARLLALAEIFVPVHGDFSADQAVIGADGRVALIDLDSAGLGDPAADLGCAAAALACEAVSTRPTRSTDTARLDALLDGYAAAGGPADPSRVAVHTAAHLIRRTVEPFRLGLTDHWAQAAGDLLDRATAAMSQIETTHPNANRSAGRIGTRRT